MSRKMLLIALLGAVPSAVVGQVLAPAGPKVVAKPTTPVMAVPVAPVATAPVGVVNATRTIDVLKAAGIVNPTLDRPITLTPRAPYIDDLTYLAVSGGDYTPQRNVIGIRYPEGGVTSSWAYVSWNASPDRRYVVDCTFDGTGENYRLTFRWGRDQTNEVRIAGGHAGVVLPVGAEPPVRMSAEGQVSLKQCDITPFGS